MLLLLSPAKSLNFNINTAHLNCTVPSFLSDSKILALMMQKFSCDDLAQLMKISEKLAQLNYQRFQDFATPFTNQNSKPAIFVFDGDVYDAIDAEKYSKQDLDFAQQHLRILSGLYGLLRPLDLMQAYRLEMSTAFKNSKIKNLYQFWQEKITNYLNEELLKTGEESLINLASEEYFKAVEVNKIKGRVINIIFKDDNKIIGIFAKKARGLMADFVIKNKIKNSQELKEFNLEKYKFQKNFSDQNNWHFCR